MKRTESGFWVSNRGAALCRFDYSGIADSLVTDPDEIRDFFFFAMAEKEGIHECVANEHRPLYRFLSQDIALRYVPKSSQWLLAVAGEYEAAARSVPRGSGEEAIARERFIRFARGLEQKETDKELVKLGLEMAYLEFSVPFWLDYATHVATNLENASPVSNLSH